MPETDMRISPIVCAALAAGFMAVSVHACASMRGASGHCTPETRDSLYLRFAPAFRACGVDRQAKVLSTPIPSWTPSSSTAAPGTMCYSADLEFVVDTTGKPMLGSVQILRTNTADFADAYAARVPTWEYEPAEIAGNKVRQIVAYKARAQSTVTRVVVTRGSGPPSGVVGTTGGPVHGIPSC